MPRDVLTHFPWMSLVLAGQLIFFMVFVGALLWVFRKGSQGFYDRMANLPADEGGSTHE